MGTHVSNFVIGCRKYKRLPFWLSSSNSNRFNAIITFRAFNVGNRVMLYPEQQQVHRYNGCEAASGHHSKEVLSLQPIDFHVQVLGLSFHDAMRQITGS